MNALKGRVYDHECPECGHMMRDSSIWVRCQICGCNGRYDVVAEYPTSI